RINPDGTKIGDDIQVTTTYAEGGDSFDASLAWSGSEYGLSWVDGRPNRPQRPEIYFARFDRNGEKLGTDTRITDAPTYKESPFLLWNGNEYGLAWHDNRDEQVIPFARISRDGVKLASEIHASNVGGYPNVPMLAWNGMEYGLSWFNTQVSPPSIFFTRVSGAGNKIGEDVVIQSDNGIAKPAPITWLGGQYAMTWGRNIETGFPDTTFYLRKISSEGQQIGRDLPIAEGSSPKMVWTGAEYGVVWHHDWNRNMELYFGRFDPNGNEIGETIRITNDRNSSYGADLVWNEQQREYAFSWVEGIYESGLEVDEIKFTRVQIIQPCP
ncbi:MAG: hypothetical protein Q7T03_03130, partial [Deltaproteobacteria bacterium]|nr:hypothetical protein [Deltaproteobacteria bacterium]